MNTLHIFHQLPTSTNTPLSYYQKTQPLHSTLTNHHLQPSTPPWKLHAQAKGFGGDDPNPIQKKNNMSKPSSTRNNVDDDDDKIPQIVFDRIIRRILVSVGLPMAVGVVLLKVFDVLKGNGIWDVPLWVSFVTTFVFLGGSVLGVVYGSLSTSWDPEKDGSFLGFDEAKMNWDEMWKEENKN